MATAGYLISRAAQQPPILELSVAIVGVRFFGISRGVLRYLERLVSHDATLRAIATVRTRLFARLEPLVPSGLPGVRTGDLLGRFVADVDTLQNLYLRALGPAAVALLAGAVAVAVALIALPAAGLVLAAFLLLAGVVVPLAGVAFTRAALRREAPARARAHGRAAGRARRGARAGRLRGRPAAAERVDAADARCSGPSPHRAGRRRRRGCGDRARDARRGRRARGRDACRPAGALPGVLLAMLALLALASFEAVRPLPAPPPSSSSRRRPARGGCST